MISVKNVKILSIKKGDFNTVKMTLKKYNAITKIYRTGKIVITGGCNEEELKKAARHSAKLIKSKGFDVKFRNFEITNMSASYDVGFKIHLTKLCENLGKEYNDKNSKKIENVVHYEPEHFSSLKYWMKDPKLTIIIFASGKIIFTGAKEKDDFKKALKKIYTWVKKYENTNI